LKILNNVDMTGNKITGLAATPTDNSDAASKAYVDTKAAVQSVNTKTGAVVLSAGDIAISDTANNFSTDTVQGAIEQLFQSANSGKTAIAGAIGSPAESSDTFSQLATKITEGKQQIATATANAGVSGSSTFTELAAAVSSLGSPTFGVSKNVQYDENIVAGEIVESYYRTLSLSTGGVSITTQPGGTANALTWSPNGLYLAVGGSVAPRVTVYKRNVNTFTSVGVAASFTSNATGLSFSSDGDYLAATGTGSSPRFRVFKRSGDVFTEIATANINGGTNITASGNACSFSPDTNFIAVGQVISSVESLMVYSRSGDIFTKLNISPQPPNDANAVTWSPDGAYLVVGSATSSDFLHIYRRSGTSFTKLANTVFDIMPTTTVKDVAYSPDGNYLALSIQADPFILVYKKTGAEFYQRIAAPTFKPTGVPNGLSWSPDSQYISISHAINPFFTTYKLKNDTLTNLANPSTLPTTQGNGCAWSPNANSLAIACNSGGTGALFVYNNNSTTYLFNKANTDSINPLDKIIGIAKQNGTAGQLKSVDVLVGRSLVP
jgi:WD40 repeat protein